MRVKVLTARFYSRCRRAGRGEEAPVFAVEILYLVSRCGLGIQGKGGSAAAQSGSSGFTHGRGAVLSSCIPRHFRYGRISHASLRAVYLSCAEHRTIGGNGSSQVRTSIIAASTQVLLDGFRARSSARRPAEAVPVDVAFPAIGPMLYLVSELTGENKAAVINLEYQEEKKGGVK